jgi:hypothetical protein
MDGRRRRTLPEWPANTVCGIPSRGPIFPGAGESGSAGALPVL